MKLMLNIDSGYAAIGWALFRSKQRGRWDLMRCSIIRPKTGGTNIYARMNSIASQLSTALCLYQIDEVNVEEPTHFGGASGNAVAKTSLLGLSASVGYYAAWSHARGARFQAVPVNMWKGQMPKQLVNKRIARTLTRPEVAMLSLPASHDWDAVGIGLWAQGRFG